MLKRSSHAAQPSTPPPPYPDTLVTSLLGWFQTHARDLPWRKETQAYGVWVSEIMLQQTQVATVIPFWNRWMKRLPDILTLARAKPATVIKLWEGLGYYSRARNLHAAARRMQQIHHAQVPDTLAELLALPGIGRYTAGAILSIAFNHPEPILDGNVMRVLTRLFRLAGDPRTGKLNQKLWQIAADLVQQASHEPKKWRTSNVQRPTLNIERLAIPQIDVPCSALDVRCSQRTMEKVHGTQYVSNSLEMGSSHEPHSTWWPCSAFNQSLMELGALVCLPANPLCDNCPIQSVCGAYQHREVEKLPSPRPKQRYHKQRMAAFVLQKGNRFLVRQRPSHGVNARLWEFPSAEFSTKSDVAKTAAKELAATLTEPTPFLTIHHAIMNLRITTEAYHVNLARSSPKPKWTGRFCTLTQLHQLTFPSAHRQIVDHLARHPSQLPPASRDTKRHRKALRPGPRKKRHETNGET